MYVDVIVIKFHDLLEQKYYNVYVAFHIQICDKMQNCIAQ